MGTILRVLKAALVGSAVGMFTTLLVGTLIPRFEYALAVIWGFTGFAFVLAGSFTSKPSFRRSTALWLVALGTFTLFLFGFGVYDAAAVAEPIGFICGGLGAYGLHRFKFST